MLKFTFNALIQQQYTLLKSIVLLCDNLSDNEKFIRLFNDQPRALARFVKDIFLYRKSLIYK